MSGTVLLCNICASAIVVGGTPKAQFWSEELPDLSAFSSTFNGVDIAILGVVALFALHGISRGFVHGVFGVVALIFSVGLALMLQGPISAAVVGVIPTTPSLAKALTIVVVFGVFQVALSRILGLASSAITTAISLSPPSWFLNALVGALPGAIRGALLAGLVMMAQPVLPVDAGLRGELERSYLGGLLVKVMTPTLDLAAQAAGKTTERLLPVLSPTPVPERK